MKKIIGISLVALFAAVPMMASADNVTLTGTVEVAEGDSGKVAAVSYVKGAYNALGLAVNSKQDQLKVGETDISSSVVGASDMHALSSVAEASDSALVTEKAVLTAITSAVSAADGAMDTRVDSIESVVNDEDTGLATKASQSALESLAGRVSSTEESVATLAGASSVEGSVAHAEASAAAAVSAASAAQQSVDSALASFANYTTTADLEETYATKAGVEKTIDNMTFSGTLTNTAITGTVNAMAEWGSSEVTEVAMTGSVTSGAVSVTKSAGASYTTE